jgi:hypothetical protein
VDHIVIESEAVQSSLLAILGGGLTGWLLDELNSITASHTTTSHTVIDHFSNFRIKFFT